MSSEPVATREGDLASRALALGDDALVLAQRLCAWVTQAPSIEEDLALSNIALDLVGHARVLLTRSGYWDGTGRSEDDLAFLRDGREFRNTLLVELPNGDFAFTIARQLVYSCYATAHYAALAECAESFLAAFGARAAKEVDYHRTHAEAWTRRLGSGTAESQRRMQEALDLIWPYTDELFEADAAVTRLDVQRLVPAPGRVRQAWQREVGGIVERAGLRVPKPDWTAAGGRCGHHSEEFGLLLAEMQSVHRQHPGGSW